MKPIWIKRMAVSAVVLLIAQGGSPVWAVDMISAKDAPPLATPMEKASYSVGVETARNLKRQGMDLDPDLVIRGMQDVLQGGQLLLTDEELLRTMNAYASELHRKQTMNRVMAAQDNKLAGEKFLAENQKMEGVVTLPSGLQYKILNAGSGKKPTATDTVECQYRGYLLNGTEFDSTYRSGQAATFKLNDSSIILGLREALMLMPTGSTWQLFIPPQLAYVGRSMGRDIGPNSTLIYEVELLGIK